VVVGAVDHTQNIPVQTLGWGGLFGDACNFSWKSFKTTKQKLVTSSEI